MITGLSLQNAAARLSVYYGSTQRALSYSLSRLAAGKNYLDPSDGIADYMRLQSAAMQRRGYERVQRDLGEAQAMMTTAETAGMSIEESLRRMKDLVKLYWQNTNDPMAQEAYENEFNAYKDTVNSVLNGNYYFGVNLSQAGTVASVILSPTDISRTLTISFEAGDIVDTSGLAIDAGGGEAGALAALETQYGAAKSYLVKVSGYLRAIDAQTGVVHSAIDNLNAYESTVNDVDDIRELNSVVTNDIRSQATLSMLAQGNMYRMGVLKLLE